MFQEQFPETEVPQERWTKAFGASTHLMLEKPTQLLGYLPPKVVFN
jgi:hypothetical protein